LTPAVLGKITNLLRDPLSAHIPQESSQAIEPKTRRVVGGTTRPLELD